MTAPEQRTALLKRARLFCDALERLDNNRAGDLARLWVEKHLGMEHGTEGIELPDGRWLIYVNRGDTYDETLVCVADSCSIYSGATWNVSSWGDTYEELEREANHEAVAW